MIRTALLLLLLLPGVLAAQRDVRSLTGSTSTPPAVRDPARQIADPDSARRTLVRWYVDHGFFTTSVSITGDTTPGMTSGTIEVREGARARIDVAAIAAPDSLRPIIDSASVARLRSTPFDTDSIETAARRLLGSITSQGYALAQVQPDIAITSDSTATVILRVEPGDLVRIVDVVPLEAPWADRTLVRRAASVPTGTVYTPQVSEDVRLRLSRLPSIRAVGLPQLQRVRGGEYNLAVPMEEGTPNIIDGVIGYQPSTDSSGGDLFGLVRLSLADIFGGGRLVDIYWRGAPTGSQLLLRYAEPWLFDLPLELAVQYDQDEQRGVDRSLYIQRMLGATLAFAINDRLEVEGGGSVVWTTAPFDTLSPCNAEVGSSRLLASNAAARFDTRDDAINPRSGFRLSIGGAVGLRNFTRRGECDTLPGTLGRQRGEVDLEGYIPVTSFLVAVGGAHYQEVLGDALDISDLFTFGGIGSVRGLREDELRLRRAVWGTVELRIPLDRFSHAGVFLDLGSVWSPTVSGERVFGYGVAGQIETPVGIARVAFALGRGDTFDRGKVSVGLVNRF